MARRQVRSVPMKVRNVERQVVQNQQAIGTSQTEDVLYTADDQVTLKRVIWDFSIAGNVPTAGGHALLGLWIVPKDVSFPTLSLADGEVTFDKGLLIPIPFQWGADSDGHLLQGQKDAKFSRKLNPGDTIVYVRKGSADNNNVSDKSIFQFFLIH